MTSDLRCPDCDEEYAAGPDEPWRCGCGHPLEFTESPIPSGTPPPYSRLDTQRGLWTFYEFLPVSPQVSLGEGFTPLVDAPHWDAQFKLEYVMPTGSFKDRGATTTLSRAAELGVEKVIEDSSGNAGAAIATYAARAGIEADIYVPAGVSQSKLMAIQRTGARPVRVEGAREDIAEACIDAAGNGEGWYASHAWNPAFLEGTKTFALEVLAQREWTAPDAVVIPVGHGTLFLGAYRGFRAAVGAGIIDESPRLYAIQAAGYAPIADAFEQGGVPDLGDDDEDDDTGLGLEFHAGTRMHDADEKNEVADSIHIREPARKNELVEAVWATGGDAIAVDADPMELALDDLHRAGFYVEPTCAIAVAGLVQLREDGQIDGEDDVVVPLTGSGLKTL